MKTINEERRKRGEGGLGAGRGGEGRCGGGGGEGGKEETAAPSDVRVSTSPSSASPPGWCVFRAFGA